MNKQDFINGIFEVIAGSFLVNNCLRVLKDKKVNGVSIVSTSFFTTLSFWYLYYYTHLDQWFSLVGGMFVALANLTWVGLMVNYRKNK